MSDSEQHIQELAMAEETPSKLSAEDLARVRHVTSTGVHAKDRKPFRPWLLLAYIAGFILFLGQLSVWLANFYIN
ncbi:MAG: DUF3094 family protein [Pseudomonadales bacterium]